MNGIIQENLSLFSPNHFFGRHLILHHSSLRHSMSKKCSFMKPKKEGDNLWSLRKPSMTSNQYAMTQWNTKCNPQSKYEFITILLYHSMGVMDMYPILGWYPSEIPSSVLSTFSSHLYVFGFSEWTFVWHWISETRVVQN